MGKKCTVAESPDASVCPGRVSIKLIGGTAQAVIRRAVKTGTKFLIRIEITDFTTDLLGRCRAPGEPRIEPV
ncbi:MAG: hypothetical protein PsegKO_24710 [Pseudohongiellaceae bacterium]